MKYRYFGNVMAHIEFDVEADSAEQADEIAKRKLDMSEWREFRDIGHELGRYTQRGSWEEVERSGDI